MMKSQIKLSDIAGKPVNKAALETAWWVVNGRAATKDSLALAIVEYLKSLREQEENGEL